MGLHIDIVTEGLRARNIRFSGPTDHPAPIRNKMRRLDMRARPDQRRGKAEATGPMPYVAPNYATNPNAKLGTWVCTRTSSVKPFAAVPPDTKTHSPDFCGQCVSYVTTVCTTLPVNTGLWKKGIPVKGNAQIATGTAIATFDSNGKYSGHAAIYESQTSDGINVVDQWVTPPANPIHRRKLRYGAAGNSNNGDNFFVID